MTSQILYSSLDKPKYLYFIRRFLFFIRGIRGERAYRILRISFACPVSSPKSKLTIDDPVRCPSNIRCPCPPLYTALTATHLDDGYSSQFSRRPPAPATERPARFLSAICREGREVSSVSSSAHELIVDSCLESLWVVVVHVHSLFELNQLFN